MSAMSNAEKLATRYLHEAVKRQFDAQVSGLIRITKKDGGIDIDLRDGYGMTALMWAAGRGFTNIASILLENEADVEAGNDLLSMRAIEYLETGGDDAGWNDERLGKLTANRLHGWTAIAWAARNGQSEIVSLLLDRGANVNAMTKDGFTALVHALEKKHRDTANLLLERGANPTLEVGGSSPSLMYASRHGFLEIVQAILDRGGSLDATDSFGQHALWNAVVNNHAEVVTLLLERGSNANTIGAGGESWTLLHNAAADDTLEIAKMLLDYGADIDFRINGEGVTALQAALYKMGGLRVARLLIERGANIDGALETAERFRDQPEAEEIVKLLKDRAGS